MATTSRAARFATRIVHGVDDGGTAEEIMLWIDWGEGGIWAVGRAVNVHLRENPHLAREDDWLFRGYEMHDALEIANEALDDDLAVSRDDGRNEDLPAFSAEELRVRLERWYFDHQ